MNTITNPRDVTQSSFPKNGTFKEIALNLLNYAVLAPSSHNTQPWHFKINNDIISLFADTSRALPVSDCYNRGLVISCGAALGNLEVAANFFGLKCNIDYFPDDRNHSHLADISFNEGHTITTNDRRLFSAIKDRSTSRKAFSSKSLPESLPVFLEKEATFSKIELKLVSDTGLRDEIAELTATADHQQFDDPDFREELSKWIRSNNSQQHDGVSANGKWQSNILTKMNAMIIRRFDVGDGVAALDKEIATNSPMLAILATESEEPSNWLAAGQFLSRLLLHFTASGISVGYLNQVVEILEMRIQLRKIAGISGYPQLLLRLGKAEPENTSARRPLDEVITIV